MKPLFYFVILLFVCNGIIAQGDIPTTKPLTVGAKNNLDVKASNKGTALRMPSVLDKNLTSKNNSSSIKMLPDRDLKQAGHDLKIEPKFLRNFSEGNVSSSEGGDIYFGDIKTKSRVVTIIIRDFGEVDGDRIKLMHDKAVVDNNVLLSGAFKKEVLTLSDGFNVIEFQALNQGYVGFNTAQFVILDDKEKVLYNNMWNLGTKAIASIIVVKEKE